MPHPPSTNPPRSSGLNDLVHPPMRADARRNYDALVAAADEIFTAHGPGASLDEIARRAGVGNATLYRHFPDRRDLLVAVCVGEVEALCLVGEDLQANPDSGQALSNWLRAYIDHVSAKHGLAAAFATGRRDDSDLVTACQSAVLAIGNSLLQRAQHEGAVRIDVNLPDIITLVNAIAMASETTDTHESERMLAIVLAGIAASRPARSHPATHEGAGKEKG
jgi:AcrR family transcriptional regulator